MNKRQERNCFEAVKWQLLPRSVRKLIAFKTHQADQHGMRPITVWEAPKRGEVTSEEFLADREGVHPHPSRLAWAV